MREGCATGMHQLNRAGGKDVADEIKEVLRLQMGVGRYNLWFGHDVGLQVEPGTAESSAVVTVTASSPFAAERLRARHAGDIRSASKSICGNDVEIHILHSEPAAAAAPAEDSATENAAPSSGDSASPTETNNGLKLRFEDESSVPDNLPAAARRSGSAGARPVSAGSRRRTRGPRPIGNPLFREKPAEEAGETAGDSTGAVPAPPRWAMTLNQFVVGSCNELAHTATRMVVDNPGAASPIYFWGPSGSGKTHLVTAIRDSLRRKHRLRRVIQLTAEDFTNDFTTALRGSGLPAFRRRYRDVDALMIDDVQFFGGNKRATLRELLHTVDALLRTRKQLIFAGDRPPMEIEGIPAELAGRLSGGMMCGIGPMDVATRRAVLEQFAAMVGLELPANLLDTLSESVAGDGRVMSGLVNQIWALQQMRGKMPTWQQVLDSAAGDILRTSAPIIGLADIQKAVCDTFGLPKGTLQSRGQQRSVSQPRMLAMYLARQHTRAAFSEIGDYFGNRSHSTVIAATKRVAGWLDNGENAAAETAERQRMKQAAAAIENLLRTG